MRRRSESRRARPGRGTRRRSTLSERIHKVLARAGLGSRRAVERWIAEGQVRVNGKAVEAGAALDEGDRVEVRGRRYQVVTRGGREPRWLRYNKPEGQVSTRDDPEGRPTVFAQLPKLREGGGRWVSLGRLDVNTTGLMLFTDDGEAANALTHPSAGIEREYAVRVRGAVDADTLERMTRGILLDDGEARFDRIVDAGGQGANHWYHVVLHEGRRNEVRRIWEAVGCQVARLTRVRFGPVELPRRLRAGRFEDLPAAEAARLNELAGRGGGGRVLALEPFRGRHTGPAKKKAAAKKAAAKKATAKKATAKKATAKKATAKKATAKKATAKKATAKKATAKKKAAKKKAAPRRRPRDRRG